MIHTERFPVEKLDSSLDRNIAEVTVVNPHSPLIQYGHMILTAIGTSIAARIHQPPAGS